MKLNEGRLLGSKATAGVEAEELKLNPPGDADVDDIPPKLKPDVAATGAVDPKLNPVLDEGVDENDDVAGVCGFACGAPNIGVAAVP